MRRCATIMAKDRGFTEFVYGKKYSAGDKVYFNNRGKTLALAVIGKEEVEKGVNITAAHKKALCKVISENVRMNVFQSDALRILADVLLKITHFKKFTFIGAKQKITRLLV